MSKLRRILVAVKDPAARTQPAVRKAAQLAAASGARLELFHAIATPIYFDTFFMEGTSLQETQRQWRDRLLAQLEKQAAKLRSDGLKVDTACEWDFPAYEAVIRRATRMKADLIVAERHATLHILPWLLRFNDWELLRRSPVSVLLIKRPQPYRNPTVLAAIDPSHSFAKPARLDADIIAAGQMLTDTLGGKLHVVHAWAGATFPAERLGPVSADLTATLERQVSRVARKTFSDAVSNTGIPTARRHLVAGHAVDVIPRVAKKQHAAVVVMGAISRSGLKRLVIGNIAEQVLDALPCDVLVLKPTAFKSRVAGKTRGAQLVATPLPYA
jgi:universal stress protein E